MLKRLVFSCFSLILIAALIHSAKAQVISVDPSDSIQDTLRKAYPGDVIFLSDGIYHESFKTVRDGTKDKPIIIEGSQDAIVKGGGGSGRIIQVFHDNIHLKGFTVDGLDGDESEKESYKDKLIFVQGSGDKKGIDGLKVIGMTLKNSGGEALRLKYFVHDAEIAYNNFLNVGVYDFRFAGDGKNGEALYLGTSSNQWGDGKNPTGDPDGSRNNWIHHNNFNTNGNECIDIKEGSTGNIVEYNICTGQKDPDSGGISARGDRNILRNNEVYGNTGAGIRLGGNRVGFKQYGKGNEVYDNNIHNNGLKAIKEEVSPQLIGSNLCRSNHGGEEVCRDTFFRRIVRTIRKIFLF